MPAPISSISDPSNTLPPSPTGEATTETHTGHWISHWARTRPEALAWSDDHRACDYATAEDRIQRLTAWLAAQGVGRGDRVALWLGNRGAMLEALFAAARLAAIVLPVNARLTPAEVAFQFDDATPSLLLVEDVWEQDAKEVSRRMSQTPPIVLSIADYEDVLDQSPPTDACLPVDPDDPMILMYTSGTTGKPKGALLPHRKTLYNSRNAEIYFDLRASDRVLVVAPLFHSLGLQILALPAVHVGAGVILREGFDAAGVWQTIEKEGITYYGGVPTMHERLLDALERGRPFAKPPASLRFAFTAGAPAAPGLIRAYHERGLLLKQGYGQTETSILTCIDPERALSKAGSVGQPVRHVELRLIDPRTIDGDVEGWRDVAAGEIGEIVARGPITMLGYWRRPEATAETLREGWLRTGDLATRDEDFDITLVGRAREMYISGGENVYPAEVEATLTDHPDIVEAAVVAIPDPKWGEVGRAHVVTVEREAIDANALTAWLQTRLARFKQPREFVFEKALPRTASGKIQKHLLQPPTPASSETPTERTS